MDLETLMGRLGGAPGRADSLLHLEMTPPRAAKDATWPDWLDDNGLMDVAERAVKLLDAQVAAWEATPPPHPVVVAGTAGGAPSVARLIRGVAGLPGGAVVLPGLDLDLPDEVWDALPESHPQAGMRRLLLDIQATRGDVRSLPHVPDVRSLPHVPAARAATDTEAYPNAAEQRGRRHLYEVDIVRLLTFVCVVGVHAAGPSAGELLAFWSLVIAQRVKLSDVAGLVFPYPTLSEVSRRAATSFYLPQTARPLVRRLLRGLRALG